MTVIDASALVAFFLREPGWEGLGRHLAGAATVDHAIKEFYNAVWKAVTLRRYLSLEEADAVISLFESYVSRGLIVEPESTYIKDAFRIALEHGVTVYDALYIAQALRRGGPLLSLDYRQREVARSLGVAVIP